MQETDVFYGLRMIPENQKNTAKRSIAFMNSIPADVWRGGEKWMVNAAAGLAGRGHTVICIGRKQAIWLEKAAGASGRGVETLGLPIHSDFDPFIISRLVRLFNKRHKIGRAHV